MDLHGARPSFELDLVASHGTTLDLIILNLMSPYETNLGLRNGAWVLQVFLQGLGHRFR